jgi:hypothetical protein
MTASLTITLNVPAVEKHCQQMRHAAHALTDVQSSIEVSQSAENPKRLTARFSVPDARQEDVVDRIGREFWRWMEDYSGQAEAEVLLWKIQGAPVEMIPSFKWGTEMRGSDAGLTALM